MVNESTSFIPGTRLADVVSCGIVVGESDDVVDLTSVIGYTSSGTSDWSLRRPVGGVFYATDQPLYVTSIPTGCEPLDDLLGSGLDRGTITQIYGPPASGKTNVALSAAVEVAAAGNRALYIDTEGLSIDRFGQLAGERDDEDVPDRIIISDAHDFEEQREAVADAADFAEQVDLIVLDSATGFYRLERVADGEGEALRAVARQLTSLLSLARKHDIAVLVTNQVYTDPESDATRPLGGHTLTHWTGIVIRLERFRGGNRRATLVKHHAKETGDSVRFKITDSGLSGATDASVSP